QKFALQKMEDGIRFSEKTRDRTTQSWLLAHRGALFRVHDRLREALRDYERARQLKPAKDELGWILTDMGDAYRRLGLLATAKEIIKAGAKLDTNNASWNNARLGEILQAQGSAEALVEFRKAIIPQPNRKPVFNEVPSVAQALYSANEPKE